MDQRCPKHTKKSFSDRIANSWWFFGLLSLFWLLFRTGTRPTRIVYPCQRAALANSVTFFSFFPAVSFSAVLTSVRKKLGLKKTLALVLTILIAINVYPYFNGVTSRTCASSSHYSLPELRATESPASDVFYVGIDTQDTSEAVLEPKVEELLFEIMDSYEHHFYATDSTPDGYIASDDVVIFEVNVQDEQRKLTNTDLCKEIIDAILKHPDGFTGEVVIADNAQGAAPYGGMDNPHANNAEDHDFSFQDCANLYDKVTTYLWDDIRTTVVNEFDAGDDRDGYVEYATGELGNIDLNYPKFTSRLGTKISLKKGIWNGSGYESRLKVINMNTLRSHGQYGVTASVKNYLGVISRSLFDYHSLYTSPPWTTYIQAGCCGLEMAQANFPTLNILDALWTNPRPRDAGSGCSYGDAVWMGDIIISEDPVALDYVASKYIILDWAAKHGYPQSQLNWVDPDYDADLPLQGSLHGYLSNSLNFLVDAGYNVTMNEDRMNVYSSSATTQVHDVAVVHSTPSKTVVAEGYPLNISTMLENQGDFNEESNLTIYSNSTAIYTKTVTLPSRSFVTLDFAWNTAGCVKGNYTLKAVVDTVTNETDTSDNEYTGEWIIISMTGDITGPNSWPDGKSDIRDIGLVAKSFGAIYPDPRYNPNCDVIYDRRINMSDIALVAKQYGNPGRSRLLTTSAGQEKDTHHTIPRE